MPQLLELLAQLKEKAVIVMIYLTEAHADDVWPIGYGINQPKTLEERWSNFDRLLV